MKIIKQRTRWEHTRHAREFELKHLPGSGWSFDCDENGNVDAEKLKAEKPIAYESYMMCITGKTKNGEDIIDHGHRAWTTNGWDPAVGECNHCPGSEVILSGFTNTCDSCHTDYNGSGQELAPRHLWGEETGETAADILRGGDMFDGDY